MSVAPELLVYTAVTRGYDSPAPAPEIHGVHFVLYHDGTIAIPAGWEPRLIPAGNLSSVGMNRKLKILPHLFFQDYDSSVYIDGNILVRSDLRTFVAQALSEHYIALYRQPQRDCAYAELREIVRVGLVHAGPVIALASRYRALGMPGHAGLFEANVVFRRHNDPKCIALAQDWWAEWEAGVGRDQPALAYVNWKHNCPILNLGYSYMRSGENPYFGYRQHSHFKKRLPRLLRRSLSEMQFYRIRI